MNPTPNSTDHRLAGRSVLVLGLGESGLAMARWCARAGARVRVADSREHPPGLDALRRDVASAQVHCGSVGADLLGDAQLVLRSPGIAPHAREFAAVLTAAEESGVSVAGELHLFQWALDDLRARRGYAPKVVAVTGTNGKTTVTRLTGLMLERAGWSVAVAGNISPAMLDVLQRALDDGALPQAWVLELSSFQLHGMRDFAADAATVLNLTQDHLDWHGDMRAYAADKSAIFGSDGATGVMVLNRDDAAVMALRRPNRRLRRFGLQPPQQPGDWGVVRDGGIDWLARALPDDGPPRNRRGRQVAAEPGELQVQRLMPAEAMRIQGAHNVANALAALALGDAAGAPLAPMLHALRDYRGEPHRMQTVAVLDGVRYIDDSKGTNVGATAAALAGMDVPVVLIAGGEGKGQDFSPLAAHAVRLRAAVLIGRDAPSIAAALQGRAPVEFAATLEDAVRLAAALARSGDAVLLSPACASLDMFRNYVHRAEVFVHAVRGLDDPHAPASPARPPEGAHPALGRPGGGVAEDRGQVWAEGGEHAA